MANLDVTRKKRSPLPWILITILILAIVGYFVWQQYDKNEVDDTNTTTVDTTTRTP